MKYAVLVEIAGEKNPSFLQSSDQLSAVRKPQSNLKRWMYEMGVEVKNPARSKFVITEDGKPILVRYFLGAGSNSWNPIPEESPVKEGTCQPG